jgi:cell shape-determining protein MreD
MIYITLNTSAELTCFFVALVFLLKDKDPVWRMVIPFLMLTCLVEFFGIHMRKVWGVPNGLLYTLFLLAECSFISYFFHHLYKRYFNKPRWLFGWLAVFLTIYVTETTIRGFGSYASVSAIVMSIAFVLAALLFYYLKLKDEQFEPLLTSPSFWWVSGCLFFYFGGTACNVFFDYLKNNEVSSYSGSIRHQIFIILNIILYSFWSVSFICRYRQRKSRRLSGSLPLSF